jgi:GTPase SAR1 family protein
MSLKEIRNNNRALRIEKIPMACDKRPKDLPEPLEWKTASILVGPPKSGKTNLLMNLITKKNKFYNKQFDKIYIFSPSIHTISKKIDLPEEQLIPTLDMEILEAIVEDCGMGEEDTLIIIDDLVNSLTKNMKAILRLIYNRRHLGISIFITAQKYTKIPLELRSAMSNVYIFKTGNKKELKSIEEEIASTLDKKQFGMLVKHVFSKPHAFLYVKINDQEFYNGFNRVVFE